MMVNFLFGAMQSNLVLRSNRALILCRMMLAADTGLTHSPLPAPAAAFSP